MAASATFALKAGVWFRRGRLLMVSPDSQGTACPLSGRNSTYRPVQISGTGSNSVLHPQLSHCHCSECRDDLPHVNMKHARLGYERDAPDAHDGLMNRVCATSMRFYGN